VRDEQYHYARAVAAHANLAAFLSVWSEKQLAEIKESIDVESLKVRA